MLISLDTSKGFAHVVTSINRCTFLSNIGFDYTQTEDPDTCFYSRGDLRLEIQEIQRMGNDLWNTFIALLS